MYYLGLSRLLTYVGQLIASRGANTIYINLVVKWFHKPFAEWIVEQGKWASVGIIWALLALINSLVMCRMPALPRQQSFHNQCIQPVRRCIASSTKSVSPHGVYDSELLITHNNLSLCAILQCCSGFPLSLGNHNSHNISSNNNIPRLFCLRFELLLRCSQLAHSRCASMPSSHNSGLTYHSA